ncbi:MAG TPA: hypothetical protein VM008_04825, partial [Phycisphaerae bacterium]|nr:hypothetical protein [Phycisphaerae bacterium]
MSESVNSEWGWEVWFCREIATKNLARQSRNQNTKARRHEGPRRKRRRHDDEVEPQINTDEHGCWELGSNESCQKKKKIPDSNTNDTKE